MTVFVVPDDFPLVSLAVTSPLVSKGDVIVVKEGVESEVVVVPPEKTGLRIMSEGGGIPEFLEDSGDGAGDDTGTGNEVGDIDPPGGEDTPEPAGDPAETSGSILSEKGETEEPGEHSDTVEPDDMEEPDDTGEPDDSAAWDDAAESSAEERTADEPDPGRRPFIMVSRAGAKIVGSGHGSWVIVHRNR
ncbi:MAG: hypothetical protein M0Z41_00125 [Peptococcaceae bacterium]|nr:hypothetical protein [Peptococcaceae bacterium]